MPEKGLEPPLSCPNRILSPARLPVPPLRRGERFTTNAGPTSTALSKWRELEDMHAQRPAPTAPLRRYSAHLFLDGTNKFPGWGARTRWKHSYRDGRRGDR